MHLRYSFSKLEMEDDIMAVPVGDFAEEFSGMLRLNDTGSMILDLLSEETTEADIIAYLMKNYEDEYDVIASYVYEFIGELREAGILEE